MELTQLMQHPELMDKETLYDLRSLIALYPYYQPARLLMLQNLYILHDPTFDEELRRAAIYITDRKVLFNLVEASHYKISKPKETTRHDKGKKETEGNRTISLIDEFLNSIPEQEVSGAVQKRKPTFLIEAFRKKPEEDTITTEKKKLNLDIEQVRLRDIHLTYNKGDTLTDVSFNQLFVEKDGKEHLVSIDSLRLKTDYHRPRKNTGKPHRGFFDVGHFDVTANMKWTIHLMEKDSLNATLTEANFKDPTMGINLTDVRFDMAANRKAISLSDITIQQTNTKLNIGHGNIILPDKETGRKFSYSTGKIKGHVVLKDISRTFAPCLKNFHLPLQLQTTMSGTDNTIHFRNIHVSTKDKKLQISAYGNITLIIGDKLQAIFLLIQ